jgi:hypothetical protein
MGIPVGPTRRVLRRSRRSVVERVMTAEHCEYFDDSDDGRIASCPNPVVAHVEPKPIGQFAPAALCLKHVFAHIRDHAFHLGDDWSIVAVSPEAARALSQVKS